VRLVEETVPGPGPARNRGVALSTGKILAFIDADCIAGPKWLETIANNVLENGDKGIIGGDVRISVVDPNNFTLLEAYESVFAYRQREYIERQHFSGTGNLAMRRVIYDAVGPFAGIQIAEDRDWGRRATNLGFMIHYVPTMVVFHPAREFFDDLFAKWNRHVSHDYAETAQGVVGRARWLGRICVILASPIFEVWRILTSPRLPGWRERYLALRGVIVIRWYRALKMLQCFSRHNFSSDTWNRSNTPMPD
jgi:GT2 family glycosyltransferase